MGYNKEAEKWFYIRIQLFNSTRNHALFNWSSRGNIDFGLKVAQEEVRRKVPVDKEGKYSIEIRIRNDKTNKTEYEWINQQGNVRVGLAAAEDFTINKLGISMIEGIRNSIEEQKGKV